MNWHMLRNCSTRVGLSRYLYVSLDLMRMAETCATPRLGNLLKMIPIRAECLPKAPLPLGSLKCLHVAPLGVVSLFKFVNSVPDPARRAGIGKAAFGLHRKPQSESASFTARQGFDFPRLSSASPRRRIFASAGVKVVSGSTIRFGFMRTPFFCCANSTRSPA